MAEFLSVLCERKEWEIFVDSEEREEQNNKQRI